MENKDETYQQPVGDRGLRVLESFLTKYPQYRSFFDNEYQLDPFKCDSWGNLFEVCKNLEDYTTEIEAHLPLVMKAYNLAFNFSKDHHIDQLKAGLKFEIEEKTRDMNTLERRNFYLIMKENLGKDFPTIEGYSYLDENFKSFLHVPNLFAEDLTFIGVDFLRDIAKKKWKFWKKIEGAAAHEIDPVNLVPDTVVKKVLLLYELGITDHLIDYYNLGTNYSRLGKILALIIDEDAGTIRKVLDAQYKDFVDKKNDPTKADKNIAWLEYTMSVLKLRVQNINKNSEE